MENLDTTQERLEYVYFKLRGSKSPDEILAKLNEKHKGLKIKLSCSDGSWKVSAIAEDMKAGPSRKRPPSPAAVPSHKKESSRKRTPSPKGDKMLSLFAAVDHVEAEKNEAGRRAESVNGKEAATSAVDIVEAEKNEAGRRAGKEAAISDSNSETESDQPEDIAVVRSAASLVDEVAEEMQNELQRCIQVLPEDILVVRSAAFLVDEVAEEMQNELQRCIQALDNARGLVRKFL